MNHRLVVPEGETDFDIDKHRGQRGDERDGVVVGMDRRANVVDPYHEIAETWPHVVGIVNGSRQFDVAPYIVSYISKNRDYRNDFVDKVHWYVSVFVVYNKKRGCFYCRVVPHGLYLLENIHGLAIVIERAKFAL